MIIQKRESNENVKKLQISKQNKFNCIYDLVKHIRKYKSIEYLEVNLKKNRENLRELFEEISISEYLIHLNLDISQNHFNQTKIAEFGFHLSKCSNLTVINFNLFDNQISNQGVDHLFFSLSLLPLLSQLTLDLRSNLIKQQTNLINLQNQQQQQQMISKGVSIKTEQSSKELQEYHLFNCHYSFNELKYLNLNLSDNEITTSLVSELFDFILNINSLQQFILILMCSNQSEQHLQLISQKLSSLQSSYSNLTKFTLDINSNIIGLNSNEQDYNKIILNEDQLQDNNNKYQNESINELCLDLSNNFIKSYDLQYIGKQLQIFKNVKKLDLLINGNQLMDNGVENLKEIFQSYKQIERIKLGLQNNQIEKLTILEIIIIIIQYIPSIISLEIDLGWNTFKYDEDIIKNKTPQLLQKIQDIIGINNNNNIIYNKSIINKNNSIFQLKEIKLKLEMVDLGEQEIDEMIEGIIRLNSIESIYINLDGNILKSLSPFNKLIELPYLYTCTLLFDPHQTLIQNLSSSFQKFIRLTYYSFIQ